MGHNTKSHRHLARHKIGLAIQGGAALGAFAEGAIHCILENPHVEIKGASGTSSGALNGAFLIEGLIKGGERHAQRRVAEFWLGLSNFHDKNMRALFKIAEPLYQMADLFLGPLAAGLVRPIFRQGAEILTGGKILTESPILDFFATLEKEKKGLDFHALQAAEDHFLIVNATHIPPATSPWKAERRQERVFTGRQITPEVLAASCSLEGMMSPVEIKGKNFRDGGYLSNPHLPRLVRECERVGAKTIVIIRSWPGQAFPAWEGGIPLMDDHKRAFHNGITDTQLSRLQKNSGLRVVVIEPSHLELEGPHLMPPELRFHAHHTALRREAGYAAARAVMASHPDIFLQWSAPSNTSKVRPFRPSSNGTKHSQGPAKIMSSRHRASLEQM